MKILKVSDLVSELNKMLIKHGDCNVCVYVTYDSCQGYGGTDLVTPVQVRRDIIGNNGWREAHTSAENAVAFHDGEVWINVSIE